MLDFIQKIDPECANTASLAIFDEAWNYFFFEQGLLMINSISFDANQNRNDADKIKSNSSSADRIMSRCDQLQKISSRKETYFRAYLTPEHRQAADKIMEWMRAAGMLTRMDPAGNVVGRYEGVNPGAPAVVLASHFDTVCDAGRYDGVLGISTAIESIAAIRDRRRRFPFSLEVYGFADEEGARFPNSFIGSRATAGLLKDQDLVNTDSDGITLAEALLNFGLSLTLISEAARQSDEMLAYFELHIEQEPRLQAESLSVGAVTGIQGQTFATCTFEGRAGHAGTVPMDLRQDGLLGSAEAVLAIKKIAFKEVDIVATVGRITVEPGASNLIPDRVTFSIDLRSPSNSRRDLAWRKIRESLEAIARRRRLTVEFIPIMSQDPVSCDPYLADMVAEACGEVTGRAFRMISGAGHDAAIMACLCPMAMIFVRCQDGISHHPDEAVTSTDVTDGFRTLLLTIEKFAAAL